jgi:hypothetical protein
MTNTFQLTLCLHCARSYCPLTLSCARLTFKPRLLITAPDQKFPIIVGVLLPKEWLDSLAENDPEGRTNREVQREVRVPVSPR